MVAALRDVISTQIFLVGQGGGTVVVLISAPALVATSSNIAHGRGLAPTATSLARALATKLAEASQRGKSIYYAEASYEWN